MLGRILYFFLFFLISSNHWSGEFALLESRLERSVLQMEVVTNEMYSELFDNLSGEGEEYELETIIGRRGNRIGEFLLPVFATIHKDSLYVIDFGNQRIQSFQRNGTPSGVLNFPGLVQPAHIKFDEDLVYVVDQAHSIVRVYQDSVSGFKQVNIIGSKGVESGELNLPGSVAIDSRGLIWVSDEQNSRLEVFTYDLMFGRKSNYFMNLDEYLPNVYLKAPKGLFWVETLLKMYVIDSGTARLLSFDLDGNFAGEVEANIRKGEAFMPQSCYVDSMGHLYTADNISHEILKFDREGIPMGSIGAPSQFSQSVSTTPISMTRPRSQAYSLRTTSGFYGQDSTLSFPHGISIDQDGDLFVCDWGHNQVKVYSKSYFRKAFRFYKARKFRLAIDRFLKCDRRNEKYHLVEFYLAMCHYNLGELEVSYEGKVAWYRKVRDYLESLKLKSEIGKYQNRQIRNKALYYLSRVNSYQLDG
jgi:sugar lactone lactonase YvrE